jgi:hypothetical protein
MPMIGHRNQVDAGSGATVFYRRDDDKIVSHDRALRWLRAWKRPHRPVVSSTGPKFD